MEYVTGVSKKETVEISEILSGDFEGKQVKVNGAVHTSAAQQAFVGSVDNGVHLHGGNIVSYNLQGHDSTSSLSVAIISYAVLPGNSAK